MRSAFPGLSPQQQGSPSSPAVGNSHVFTSVLAHSGAPARGPRHFDVLGRRNAAQQAANANVSKDQALADHQLQALVRLKGASILRQRLLYLIRRQFAKEFADEGTTPASQMLLTIEEMIVTLDNSDVENAGYLRDFVKKANDVPPPPPLSMAVVATRHNSSNSKQSAAAAAGSSASNLINSSASNSLSAGNVRTGSLGATGVASSSTPLISTERMLSLGTPSFILQTASFGGVPLATESRFGIAASTVSQSASDCSGASSTCGDDEDDVSAAATVNDTALRQAEADDEALRVATMEEAAAAAASGMSGLRNADFYTMRVKRVAGTGSVACPKCLHNLADVPAKAEVFCADAATNTAERSESEKDFLVTSLTRAKADAEKKMDEMRKELLAYKKAKYATQNLAAPTSAASASAAAANAAAQQSGSPQLQRSNHNGNDGPLVLNDSFVAGTMSPPRASTPGPLQFGEESPLPPVAARANSSMQTKSSSYSSPNSRHQPSNTTTRRSGTPAAGATRRSLNGAATAAASNDDTNLTSPTTDASGRPTSNVHQVIRMNLALRVQTTLREMRSKLHAVKAGIRSFQFKEVMHQFSQHVVPQLQQIQATNKRLLDRDYILEKLLLDALCKVGTMPDAGSPEGYLPEGGPLHVGTYSLLDDRRFLEWTRRINETLTGKVAAVQTHIATLAHDARQHQASVASSGTSNKKELMHLEERVTQLEGSVVENECFNVSNILDHTFDSSTAVQGSRRTELVTLLKHTAETNEEIRLIYVVPHWTTKPQLRVKLNMWRQRRMEALQKVEQLLSQELQHFVSSGAQKIMLKGKLMTVRELIQLASRLHLMPAASSGGGSGGGQHRSGSVSSGAHLGGAATANSGTAAALAAVTASQQLHQHQQQQQHSSSVGQRATSPPEVSPSGATERRLSSPTSRTPPQQPFTNLSVENVAAAGVAVADADATEDVQTPPLATPRRTVSQNGGMTMVPVEAASPTALSGAAGGVSKDAGTPPSSVEGQRMGTGGSSAGSPTFAGATRRLSTQAQRLPPVK